MTSPQLQRAFLSCQAIEILADDLIEVSKEFGLEFKASLAISAGSRHVKQIGERREDFIEGVLEGQFFTSEDKNDNTRQSQQPESGEVVRLLTETRDGRRGIDSSSQAINYGGFVFLFIEDIYQQIAMLVNIPS